MIENIQIILLLDVVILSFCSFLLLRYGRLAHSHPATIYLFFHIYTITLRLIALSLGAPTLFEGWEGNYTVITHNEIIRAAMIAEVALIMFTIGSIRASVFEYKRNESVSALPKRGRANADFRAAFLAALKSSIERGRKNRSRWVALKQSELNLKHIWRVVAITLPIGIVSMFLFTPIPGITSGFVDLGNWQTSSWFVVTPIWVGLALLALIYWYGFRWWLALPMVLYLTIMALQGYHRFRVIIPLILLIQIYLDRNRLSWPRPRIFVLFFIMILIFYPLKTIGQMIQDGATVHEIADSTASIASEALAGRHGDQQFLDMFAAGLTLIDEKDVTYYGQTYLALLTVPIPRQWWANKPGLADHIKEISTKKRPMGEMGMIITFLGEAYANFGYVGILLFPYLIAYGLVRAYFHAYRKSYLSVSRFLYLLIACNLIQVYRDGLISMVIFTCVNMMPLMLIVFLHYVLPRKRSHKVLRFRAIPYNSLEASVFKGTTQ